MLIVLYSNYCTACSNAIKQYTHKFLVKIILEYNFVMSDENSQTMLVHYVYILKHNNVVLEVRKDNGDKKRGNGK